MCILKKPLRQASHCLPDFPKGTERGVEEESVQQVSEMDIKDAVGPRNYSYNSILVLRRNIHV